MMGVLLICISSAGVNVDLCFVFDCCPQSSGVTAMPTFELHIVATSAAQPSLPPHGPTAATVTVILAYCCLLGECWGPLFLCFLASALLLPVYLFSLDTADAVHCIHALNGQPGPQRVHKSTDRNRWYGSLILMAPVLKSNQWQNSSRLCGWRRKLLCSILVHAVSPGQLVSFLGRMKNFSGSSLDRNSPYV